MQIPRQRGRCSGTEGLQSLTLSRDTDRMYLIHDVLTCLLTYLLPTYRMSCFSVPITMSHSGRLSRSHSQTESAEVSVPVPRSFNGDDQTRDSTGEGRGYVRGRD